MRRFGTSQRPELGTSIKIATPGPGSYRPPSDFGYLDFKPKQEYRQVLFKNDRSLSSKNNGHRSALVIFNFIYSLSFI